ncbi:MAG: lipocalin family protein [Nitrospinales bacterium]
MKWANLSFVILFALTSCATYAPIKTESEVNLNRFMGDWYVIASIPTFIEEGAHNAVESYKLNEDGTVETTFTFRQDSFDGKVKTYNPTGFVSKQSNAVWGMRFVWPFKAEYRIIYLNKDYTQTVIGRTARDYVWIMAKSPQIAEEDYQNLLDYIDEQGYDISKVLKVPQRWVN